MRHSQLAHFAGKGAASDKEAKRKVCGGVPVKKLRWKRMKRCENIVALSGGTGRVAGGCYTDGGIESLTPVDGGAQAPLESPREAAAAPGEPPTEAVALAEKDARGGFFQGCLAKSRGSTPEERRIWREGIYDQIRGVMSMQGSLNIERMCYLAQVKSRGVLSVAGRKDAGGRRDGGAIGDSANRGGAPAALRLPKNHHSRAATSRDAGEPQASGADHARG